jgi:3-oxoacyl-[acyl-carrier protein] reductase
MGVAVVTGAGRGIGRAIATNLAAAGHHLACVDVDGKAADRVARDLGGTAYRCDVSDPDSVSEMAAAVGPADILVNNAGIWRFGPLLGVQPADVSAVLGVNLLGTLFCSQAFAGGMATRGGGAIVNLSSVAASTCSPGVGMYPVSKGAIETLTRQMAIEWGSSGIRVNAVAPGLVLSEGTAANYEGEAGARRAGSVPLGRIGTVDDIAGVVGFLVSGAAAYVTGQVVCVDGGIAAGRPAIT